jgi:hypothetical protein
VSRLNYLTGWALLAVAGAFLLTTSLLPRRRPPPRLLPELEARCKKMLAMQLRVYRATTAVARYIEANADKIPNAENVQESQALADVQQQIVEEANEALQMLEGEGSALAFSEVFTQLREDMQEVKKRLQAIDLGNANLTRQQDIIEILAEMIRPPRRPVRDAPPAKSPPETAP